MKTKNFLLSYFMAGGLGLGALAAGLGSQYCAAGPLLDAIKSNDPDMARRLVEESQGASLIEHDELGNTPLHIAVDRGHTDLVREIMEKDPGLSLVSNALDFYPGNLASFQADRHLAEGDMRAYANAKDIESVLSNPNYFSRFHRSYAFVLDARENQSPQHLLLKSLIKEGRHLWEIEEQFPDIYFH